jgi:hypothetical protein
MKGARDSHTEMCSSPDFLTTLNSRGGQVCVTPTSVVAMLGIRRTTSTRSNRGGNQLADAIAKVVEKFLASGWEVVGVSRREPGDRKIDFLSIDFAGQEEIRAAFEPLTDVTPSPTRLCTRSLN